MVGVVPAAGHSRRLGLLPCSKELFPVGFVTDAEKGAARPKVVAEYLLDQLRLAGVRKAFLILRGGKWDIPAYLGDGRHLGIELAYIVIPGSSGPPDSVDRAYHFIKDEIVVFGFPDILLEPAGVFPPLLEKLDEGDCEAVLGLFPASHDCRAMDMVEYDSSGRVRAIILKPETTDLEFAWACAVWTPAFTKFLHEFMGSEEMKRQAGLGGGRQIDAQGDIPVGAVIRSAVGHGIPIRCVPFAQGSYLDIGTPDDLVRASRANR